MTYRPICDIWLLARPKIKYYGAYPNGFLERARVLLGCSYTDSLLHVCGGRAKDYPNKGFGMNDETLDIDASVNPTYLCDVTKEFPKGNWRGILADQPYTQEDANHYKIHSLPNPNKLLRDCINAIEVGRKVGFLHYICPSCPSNAKFVACIGVLVGFNNRMRCFSVYEKTKEKHSDGDTNE